MLDASVTLAWFFDDECTAYAESVEDALESVAVLVPSLWFLEVANALLTGERRRRTAVEKVRRFVALLRALPIMLDDQASSHAFEEILALGRAHNLSAYDAAYLELALRRGVPLATQDERLKAAAKAVGVVVYRP